MSKPSSAVVLGCAGTTLSLAERAFFRDADPWGFIVFARNIVDPEQVTALVAELRETVGRTAPVLVDQEGGRVQRLKPPHWRAAPPAARFAALAEHDPERGARAAWLNARLIAGELAALGIDVDCAPVLDIPAAGAHAVIGDRAYGCDPGMIAQLGQAVVEGLLAGGVLPVIKHVPGHGRAEADSHEALPTVRSTAAELEATDLLPFKALASAPLAMTAHVIYAAWDAERPATLSPAVIEHVIRGAIGFDGLLMSDDIGMKALSGRQGALAAQCLAAGCDVVLHCNGKLDEMTEVAAAVAPLSPRSKRRADAALAQRRPPEPADAAALLAELDALLRLAA